MDLKDRLEDKLTEEEMEHAPKSFEIIGDIAIIKLDEEIEHKKDIIAEEIMNQHKRLNTVLLKAEKRSGEFRTADYEILRGEKTETIHKEYGCRYKLDPTKTYFSERLGNERQRVMEKVGKGEVVHALFAGVGPYPIMIARHKEPEKVYAVEKNPDAFEYLKENIMLNKVADTVSAYKGDVRDALPEIDVKADRTIMPLPKTGEDFLNLALNYTKEGGVIHFYDFEREENLWEPVIDKAEKAAKKEGKSIEILEKEICGHYAPYVYRVCLDFRVTSEKE